MSTAIIYSPIKNEVNSTSPDYTLIKRVTETSNRYISSTPQNSKLSVAEVPFRRNINELIQHIDVKSLPNK